MMDMIGRKPIHKVTLNRFSMGETEVTQDLWKIVMGNNPSEMKGSKRPVECISWNDRQAFIEKLYQLTGKAFRLPTEAEWEFAARSGNLCKNFIYNGSNTIDDVAWYYANSYDLERSIVLT
jgi:formylglycine-generating enzyme required for sulfatase activity